MQAVISLIDPVGEEWDLADTMQLLFVPVREI